MVSTSQRPLKIFLSYARENAGTINKLTSVLEGQGLDVLVDRDDILPGEAWRHRIERMIGMADAVIFCLSPASLKSDVWRWELEVARDLSKRLIPVIVAPISEAEVPPALSSLNYIFAETPERFAEACLVIGRAVKTDIDWVRTHTRLGEQSRNWSLSGNQTSFLLRGGALQEAEEWLAARRGHELQPGPEHEEFILKSRVFANNLSAQKGKTNALILFFNLGFAVIAVCFGFLFFSLNTKTLDALNAKEYQARCESEVKALRTRIQILGQDTKNPGP